MLNLDEIFDAVDNLDREEVMSLMKPLISIDTSIPPANTYREYVDTISPFFKELGYSLEEVIVPEELVKQIPLPLEGPRINLVATKDFGLETYITFYGHMDVVPAPMDGKDKWRFPPFEATMIKSGKIYGRGTSDMKGAMVCLILALRIIKKLNLTPKYNIRIVNCTDEEVGFYPGVRYLAEKDYLKGIIFCMELAINPFVPVGAAGSLDVLVETIGKSCHSGMNFLGVNALEEMIPILNELMSLKADVIQRENKDIPGVPNFKTGEKRNMMAKFNTDVIRSGEKSNIIPDLCTIAVNRRYLPDEKYEDVKQEIQDAIDRGTAKSKALDVRTQYIHIYPPFTNDPNSPACLRLRKVMSLVQNIPENEIRTMGGSGSTDMGVLTGYDVIIHGVTGAGSNNHGVNEFIKWSDVKLYTKELLAFLCADF